MRTDRTSKKADHMNKIKTILIDDEPLAIKRLRRLLEKHADIFEIVAEADNGAKGLEMTEMHRPEVIFLDVEMPVMNGFEMLGKLTYMPKVIFTTAFEEYAIKAFEENSIDYLLKPVDEERLQKAVDKFMRLREQAPAAVPQQVLDLLNSAKSKKEIKSIPVKIGDKFLLISTDRISYLEAKDKYVYIVTDDNNEYLTDFTLTSLEEKLTDPFLRIHRAFMINRDKIKEVHRGFNGAFIFSMRDLKNTRINSGRSYGDAVKQIFEL